MAAPATGSTGTGKARILIIDDELEIRESLEALLTSEGYEVDLAGSAAEGERKLESRAWDLVLLDLMMPDKSGMEVLRDVRERDRHTPIFMITAWGGVEAAVQAVKLGANDYVSKPWDNDKLIIEIERAISGQRLIDENTQLKRILKQRYSFPNIVGKSDRMLKVLDLVAQVAPSRSTILITGDTGTGKELIAKAIHSNSPRVDYAFVAVNSGSLPSDLLESTLFGHVRGAFTSAMHNKKGAFEVANKGTIFFDEVGTIGPETQAKLLRVIQEKEFTPLGSNEVIKVDVRILAATNADLRKMVDEKKFREDLYYRLNVININLPPLRERREDIPALIHHFLQRFSKENEKFLDDQGRAALHFDTEAMQLLLDHGWPGNVRELENVVERAVVLASTPVISVDVLPDYLVQAAGIRTRPSENGALPPDASLFEIVAEFERRTIIDYLDRCNGSQTDAAEALRVPLSTLNQKIKRLNIDVRKRGEKSN
ncbi:MAG TPA: sigma-54 dependent transcriptional regulator [Bryobacteraceae bacterium]|nr:sigma-54 dependent transcriptional regulator [Bryobacteraceae bacterium]